MGAQIIAFPARTPTQPTGQRARSIEELLPVLAQVARTMPPPEPVSECMTSRAALDRITANAKHDGRKLGVGSFVTLIALAKYIDKLAELAGDTPEAHSTTQNVFRTLVDLEAAYA